MKTRGRFSLLTGFVLAFSTTLSAQRLVSIDPDNAEQGESLGVAITGQDTHFAQATHTTIWLSQGTPTIYAYGYFPVNDTYLIGWFDIPSHAATGLQDLNVYDDIDGTLILYDSFTINPSNIPVNLVSVNPNSGQQSQFLAVLITGQNTHFTQASPATTVIFSQATQTIAWPINDTLLLAHFAILPAAPTSLQDISVYNDIDGMLTLYDSFRITPYNPVITTITPDAAYQGQRLAVTITGQNTHFYHQGSSTLYHQGSSTIPFSQGTPTAWFGQGSPTTTVVWLSQGSSTIFSSDCGIPGGELLMASFDIPVDANLGLWDVHVPNHTDGLLTLPEGFLIARPGDLTCDGIINFFDLTVLGDHWLEGFE